MQRQVTKRETSVYVYLLNYCYYYNFFLLKLLHLSREKNEAWNEHDDFKYDRGSLTYGRAFFFFYALFKMAATYRCRLVTSIHARLSTGIYQKNLFLLQVIMSL